MRPTFILRCIAAVTTLVLGACVSAPRVGQAPDAVPPQLMAIKDASGREHLAWDRPQAFGQVEGTRKVVGDTYCLLARVDLEAAGYHPRAKDASGKEIEGGGYICTLKSSGSQPSAYPPRLQRSGGVLGWDRPAAFGAVPSSDKARGDAICARAQAGQEAVAYHPGALDEAGKPLTGGGFFCSPRRNIGRAFS